jgi:hypothetical protein
MPIKPSASEGGAAQKLAPYDHCTLISFLIIRSTDWAKTITSP